MSDGPLSRLGAVSPRGQPCIPPVFRTALISRSSDWSPSVDIPASRVFAPSLTGASSQEKLKARVLCNGAAHPIKSRARELGTSASFSRRQRGLLSPPSWNSTSRGHHHHYRRRHHHTFVVPAVRGFRHSGPDSRDRSPPDPPFIATHW